MRRLVGIVAVLAAVLSLGSCSLLPGAGTDKQITAYFVDSSGLFVGNDVGVLGVPVGTIDSIEPVGDQVKVVMNVDGDVDLPADAQAFITARSIATDRYVELTPVYDGGAKMDDDGEIPLERTQTPVDFDEVLGTLSQFAEDIGGKGNEGTARAVNKFLEQSANAFRGNGQKLNDAIVQLGGAATAVEGQTDNIVGTMGSLDVLTQSLAANQATIDRFTRSVSTASQMLAGQRENLRRTLTTLSRSINVLSAFADEHRAQITSSVNKVTDVIEIVLSTEKDLKELVEVFPLALQNAARLLANGRINARLSPIFLTPLAPQLQQLCNTLPAGLCETLITAPNGHSLDKLLGGLL